MGRTVHPCRPRLPSVSADVSAWFDQYVAVFAACGRGERPASDVLDFYGAPILLTTDDTVVQLEDRDQIAGWVQGQVDGMIAADYARTDVLDQVVTPINAKTSLLRGEFSRRARDEREIQRLTVTYLITGSDDERRISALMLHPA